MSGDSKNYNIGSDAASGFGTVEDWSTNDNQTVDPVIEEHNNNAQEQAQTKRYVPELYARYKLLPSNNNIRGRAEKLEQRLEEIRLSNQNAINRVETSKSIASKLFAQVTKLFDAVVKSNDGQLANETLASISSTLNNNNATTSDYSGNLQRAMTIVKNWSVDGSDVTKQEAMLLLDNTMKDLEKAKTIGSKSYNENYENVKREYETTMKELDRTKGEIEQAIINQKNKSSAKSIRLLDNMIEQHDELKGLVPDNVPNYRLAIEASPRVCGNCRFFKGNEGADGHCSVFDFTAKSNYVCDAWQAEQVTSVHTAVRSDRTDGLYGQYDNEQIEYRPEHRPARSPMLYNNRKPKLIPGQVQGQSIESDEWAYRYNDLRYNEDPDPYTLRNAREDFVPGDYVYSTSLRSFGVVQSINDQGVVSLKLMKEGQSWGTGLALTSDLQHRSKTATKNDSTITSGASSTTVYKSIKASAEVEELVEETRKIYSAIRTVVEQHKNVLENPLSNKDVLTPLREDVMHILSNDMFKGIRSGPKRKYYRAIQTALSSIGAARQTLFECYKAINYIMANDNGDETKATIRKIMIKGQSDAYERVAHALKIVEDALVLPSATHEETAPGIDE